MKIVGDYNTSVERAFSEIDPNWSIYSALVICGTHNPENWNIEDILKDIKKAREEKIPVYAECWGHQLCAIEYARNVLGIEDATSEEWGTGTFVVKKRDDGLNVGLKDGQSYWNNYEVTIDWNKPKNFFTAQYHASYQSSPKNPHKLISNFLEYAKNKSITNRGRRF